MYFLYSLALGLSFVILLPHFLYQALRHGKYAGSFKQRLGWLPEAARADGRRTIWVHAVSVGEFFAARPLIQQIKLCSPESRIVASTTTLTGQRVAQSQSNVLDAVFYFPFDWKFAVRRAVSWVKPSAVIILETELWPNFLRECRKRGVVTILANGRFSRRSFDRYRLLRPFIRAVMRDLSLMVMQSEKNAERARELGAKADRVLVCGNLKYDQIEVRGPGLGVGEGKDANPQPPTPDPYQEIDRRFALSSSRNLIVAGSTSDGEEEMLLEALREVRSVSCLEDTRLLIAPRHPERFEEVASLISRSGFTFGRRSQLNASAVGEVGASRAAVAVEPSSSEDVILLDSIGELALVYSFAAVVFVGGSLVPHGGHNMIEPAAFAKPIVVGPYTDNFREVVSDFKRADALVQITPSEEKSVKSLASEFVSLITDRERARAIGERGRDILLAHRGATACTMEAITTLLDGICLDAGSAREVWSHD